MDAETKREIDTLKAALFAVTEGNGDIPGTVARYYEAAAKNSENLDARDMLMQRAAVLRQKASEQAQQTPTAA
jgi:hypothetical protein